MNSRFLNIYGYLAMKEMNLGVDLIWTEEEAFCYGILFVISRKLRL